MGASAAFVQNTAGILHNTLVSAVYYSIKLPFDAEFAEKMFYVISGCNAKNVKISGLKTIFKFVLACIFLSVRANLLSHG